MHRDRGHFHHRLIDMGLSQKQAVTILYCVSAVLGSVAVVITTSGELKALFIIIAAVFAGFVSFYVYLRKRAAAEKRSEEQQPAEADTPIIQEEIIGQEPEHEESEREN